MPGWQGSDRRNRLPPNWNSLRQKVLRRDGHRCTVRDSYGVRCAEPASDVDHIVRGDNHDEGNLAAICSWHHQKKSSEEGARAKAAVYAKRRKSFNRSEEHPGLIG